MCASFQLKTSLTTTARFKYLLLDQKKTAQDLIV